jgi:hypothetical protein
MKNKIMPSSEKIIRVLKEHNNISQQEYGHEGLYQKYQSNKLFISPKLLTERVNKEID